MSENQDQNSEHTEGTPAPTEGNKPRKKSNIEIYNEEKYKKSQNRVQVEKDRNKELLDELLTTYKSRADKQTIEIIKDLDIESQIKVLKAREKTKAPDPNTPSIPTPVGPVKNGLEKYITKHNPWSGELEYQIPASVLMNPEKNKQLGAN